MQVVRVCVRAWTHVCVRGRMCAGVWALVGVWACRYVGGCGCGWVFGCVSACVGVFAYVYVRMRVNDYVGVYDSALCMHRNVHFTVHKFVVWS